MVLPWFLVNHGSHGFLGHGLPWLNHGHKPYYNHGFTMVHFNQITMVYSNHGFTMVYSTMVFLTMVYSVWFLPWDLKTIVFTYHGFVVSLFTNFTKMSCNHIKQ